MLCARQVVGSLTNQKIALCVGSGIALVPGEEGIQHMKTMRTLLLCALMLTGSFAIAHHVRTDYDRSAGFCRYKTFMWIDQPQTPDHDFIKERIINAVNAQLQAKGLRL